MRTETFENALKRLDAGDLNEVRRLARPLLLDHDRRADGMYLLGRAYQIQGKDHVALYLFEQASKRVCPADTAEYLEDSRRKVEASGWTEDFTDRGHTVCDTCRLYYRAEYAECPYCGGTEKPAEERDYQKLVEDEELGWEDDILDKADRIGRGVLERARELADSRSVKEIGDRARALGKEAVERARAVSEKDEIREAAKRAKQFGSEATESARKILDSDTAKTVQDTTRETGVNLAQHVRNFVQEERARYDSAEGSLRRAIFIKWVLLGVAALVLLRVMAWIL